MNITIFDAQDRMTDRQRTQTTQAIAWVFARYSKEIKIVTVHLSQDYPQLEGQCHCGIHISFRDSNAISSYFSAESISEAFEGAFGNMQMKVERKLKSPVARFNVWASNICGSIAQSFNRMLVGSSKRAST